MYEKDQILLLVVLQFQMSFGIHTQVTYSKKILTIFNHTVHNVGKNVGCTNETVFILRIIKEYFENYGKT
jgi:hypothetical protein